MTCIVALKTPDKIIVGADRLITYHDNYTELSKWPKIKKIGNTMILGSAGRYAENNIMLNLFEPPENNSTNLFSYMTHDFVPALKSLIEKHHLKDSEGNDYSCDATFIVAIQDSIFRISYTYDINEHVSDYAVIGSGEPYALGSLHTTDGFEESFGITSQSRVLMALEAAEKYSPGVHRPFDLLEIPT